MSETLVVLTVAAPLALAMLGTLEAFRPAASRLAAWAPLPALLLALMPDGATIDLPWLLLGARWGVDGPARVFLGFTAALWLAAGVYAWSYLARDPARERFELFHLLTMTGNLGAIVSQDIASFVLFFTWMSLASYGLITHDRQPASLAAGRVYIILAVLGEVLVFWAAVLIAQQTGTLYFDGLAARLAASPMRHEIAGLLLAGFGIKLGIVPLHFWLPLAHPAAPTPASAALSGAIIKTGLLGLWRFLPLGAAALEEWGAVCIALGLFATFAAALVGLTQSNPKTVLAYSSVSQMGLVTLALGAALTAPSAWKTISAAILLFAVHHALAKASLFLGVGVATARIGSRWGEGLVAGGLAVAGLSLAGVPLTTGLAAKGALKYTVGALPEAWEPALSLLLTLTSITTTLLMARLLWLIWPARQHPHHDLKPGMAIPWAALTAGVLIVPIILRIWALVDPGWGALAPAVIWGAFWPILAGGVIVVLFHMQRARAGFLERLRIPAGDVVVPLTALAGRLWRLLSHATLTGLAQRASEIARAALRAATAFGRRSLARLTETLETDLMAGALLVLAALALFALLLF